MTSKPSLKLGWQQIILWASPASALGAVGLPVAMFIPNYYIDVVGVAPASAALVFLLLRLWDGITDPVLGIVSDRLSPPLGKRRFWVIASLPILALSIWMIFVPAEGAGALYLAGWLMLFYVGVTAMQVSHIAWGAELSQGTTSRVGMMGFYELCVIVGLVGLLIIAAVLETGTAPELINVERGETLRILAITLGIVFVITALPAVALLPEGRYTKQASLSFSQAVAALTKNRNLQYVLLANLFYRAATGVSGTLFIWYFSARLGLASIAALMIALYFMFGLVGMPVWIWLTKHFGKRRCFIAGMLLSAVFSLPLAFLAGEGETLVNIETMGFGAGQIAAIVLTCLLGLSFGVAPFLARTMIADVADVELSSTGETRTGLFYAMLTFSEKLGFALAVGFSVMMLDVIGFATGPGAVPDPTAIMLLAAIYGFVPAVLFILAAGFISAFSPSADDISRTGGRLEARQGPSV